VTPTPAATSTRYRADARLRVGAHLRAGANPGRVTELYEDCQREVGRDAPVRLVDDLADLEVGGQAAEHVGVLARELLLAPKPADQVTDRVLCVLHQVRPQRGARVVAPAVELWLQRPRRRLEVVAPGLQALALDHAEAEAEPHRAFDAGDANLAVALGRVTVACREE